MEAVPDPDPSTVEAFTDEELDALEALADLEASIDPIRPPFGVDPVLWHAAVGHFDALVDALTAEEGADAVGALTAAQSLHDLLRTHV